MEAERKQLTSGNGDDGEYGRAKRQESLPTIEIKAPDMPAASPWRHGSEKREAGSSIPCQPPVGGGRCEGGFTESSLLLGDGLLSASDVTAPFGLEVSVLSESVLTAKELISASTGTMRQRCMLSRPTS